jgi:large subunit ribosomal protein L5
MSEKDSKKAKPAAKAGGKDGKQQPAEGKQPKKAKGAQESKAADTVLDERPSGPKEPARLQTYYRDEVMKSLAQQFGYKSMMEVPRIEKIVVNMGVGEAVADKKIMDNAVADMQKIVGQKPLVTKARRSVANFKIREGYPVGAKATLRGARMYEFLDRLVNVALPRVRDFRGISARSFDGRGNYNMGVKEQIIFPEVEYDKIDAIRGMNITITTTAKTDAEAKALLAAFKFPFRS